MGVLGMQLDSTNFWGRAIPHKMTSGPFWVLGTVPGGGINSEAFERTSAWISNVTQDDFTKPGEVLFALY